VFRCAVFLLSVALLSLGGVTAAAQTDESGVIALPPAPRSGGVRWGMLSGVAVAAFAGTWMYRRFGRRTV